MLFTRRTNHILIAAIFLLMALCPIGLQGHNEIPGPPQSTPILIRGATIHTGVGKPIVGGWILFDKGVIVQVGKASTKVKLPEGIRIIEAAGKHVFPGLIASHTTLGLVEINGVGKTRDNRESAPISPEVIAASAFHGESELIPVTRSNGVLTALSVPQGGVISGRSSLMHLDGWTNRQMTVKKVVGLHIHWPSHRSRRFEWVVKKSGSELDKIRSKKIRQLDQAFAKARAYLKAKEAQKAGTSRRHRTDLRWEAMIPVVKGEVPVFLHANGVRAIQAAVAWGVGKKLKMVLVGGAEAYQVIDLLKKHQIPVIIERVLRNPMRRDRAYDAPFRLAAKLHQGGVKFAISGSGSTFAAAHQRNLPYHAAMAVAYGLSPEEALRSITRYPAEILGVGKRLGTLEPGKSATLFIAGGHILEITNRVEKAFIDGRKVSLNNKHKRLHRKYQHKYKQLKDRRKSK